MRTWANFAKDTKAAIAATYAIAITGLVVIAGAAYDYNRIMALDSELQNAADQAALAAVTQLDNSSGACARAGNAAIELLRNVTLLSNDSLGNAVTVEGGKPITVTDDACESFKGITFYSDPDTVATTDADAEFVTVGVDARTAQYAFTPLGSLVGGSSDKARAFATAGMGSAICRVPPLKICNPAEPASNTDVYLDFPVEANIGAGIKLLGNETEVPGAFGFLQTEFGSGANGLLAALAWDVRGGDCVSVDGVEVQDGVVNSARDGINVRFDVPGSGTYCPAIDKITGTCSPSVNTRKDLVREAASSTWAPYLGDDAATAHLAAYRPVTNATYDSFFGLGTAPKIMGHPRDLCHAFDAVGNCQKATGFNNGLVGNGAWDIQAYWRSNFGTAYVDQIPATADQPQPKGYPTRYQVYRWEAAHIAAGTLPGGISKLAEAAAGKAGKKDTYAYTQPQSPYAAAMSASPYGLIPGSQVDRRRLSVAMLNCYALKAKYGNSLNNKTLEVGSWIDIFLVEPARARQRCTGGGSAEVTVDGVKKTIRCGDKYSEQFEVYVELIDRTDIGGDNGSALQTIRRDTPHLIQ